ncbi:Maf family nucleotide pyrophosphatase [Flagellatimonas centrodinii]|uniref:Maf family protein n=1 Tax=Flagellatimonas centrodinii TaxID=2806210 RepID=UPI001FF020EF|nr:nucleoside triphosphate pyrophosphatase [Flagellatimonas centrodinii]ULQ47007.1 Maf family nucleotide pyrophosphatase [Flagellatimonas centrodinii]
MPASPPAPLLLASGSRYRAELLRRLQLPFTATDVDIDETAAPGEAASPLALRLAEAKSAAGARQHPSAVVIGSDQTVDCDGVVLGKPGTLARARAQLLRMSGRAVRFHTAVCLRHGQRVAVFADTTIATLRPLDAADIDRYLAREPALDCAGSFRCEALGITLFESLESRDPTALIGLPLIGLSSLLRQFGYQLP